MQYPGPSGCHWGAGFLVGDGCPHPSQEGRAGPSSPLCLCRFGPHPPACPTTCLWSCPFISASWLALSNPPGLVPSRQSPSFLLPHLLTVVPSPCANFLIQGLARNVCVSLSRPGSDGVTSSALISPTSPGTTCTQFSMALLKDTEI